MINIKRESMHIIIMAIRDIGTDFALCMYIRSLGFADRIHRPSSLVSRFPSSTLLPFFFLDSLIKTE